MGKETGLKGTVSLNKKKTLNKKDKGLKLDVFEVDQAAKDIQKKETKQKYTRVTIDIPNERYKEMKIKVITEGKTVRLYFLELMEQDLG